MALVEGATPAHGLPPAHLGQTIGNAVEALSKKHRKILNQEYVNQQLETVVTILLGYVRR